MIDVIFALFFARQKLFFEHWIVHFSDSNDYKYLWYQVKNLVLIIWEFSEQKVGKACERDFYILYKFRISMYKVSQQDLAKITKFS